MVSITKKDWDSYWREDAEKKSLYAKIAGFYRRFIISRAVKYYFNKYYKDSEGKIYLHAGCGSGESDGRIGFRRASFVLMDLSFDALRLARARKKLKNAYFVCGDILNPPFKDESINGIWNLGVMEHFNEDEIKDIFKGFDRILIKRDGKYILFWPPKYGLTVIALSVILFIANKIFRRSLRLYPDEISRFSSRKWADSLVDQTGLSISRIHFNVRDIFTHVVLIGKKG